MTKIHFNCLVLPEEAPQLADAFRARIDGLIAEGKLSGAEIDVNAANEDPQLMEQWERQNPDSSVEGREMRRYSIDVNGVTGSVNGLAMSLSKLLTPDADLPPDPVYRQFDDLLEAVAHYPWHLEIQPS